MRRHLFPACLLGLALSPGLAACGLDPELQAPRSEGAQIAGNLWSAATPTAQVDGMILRVVDLGDGRRAAVRTGGTWYTAEAAFVAAARQALAQVAGCPVGRVEVLSPVAVAGQVDCTTAAVADPDATPGEAQGG
ncbi:hypothetical protein [Zavarzinia sp. CC-PAN008]|uniref:hypothetical protein n=1 Tax=Zavarzinia sp. CC-PAN008 TaxID=3243332 RepID=UPI003F744A76